MNESEKIIAQLSEKDKARFWSLVDKRGPDECWPWKNRLIRGGYGQIKLRRKYICAHVAAHILNGGSFDRGPIIRHVKCRNSRCCNPRHLLDGTHKDNADDRECDGMTARGDKNGARIHSERMPRGAANGKVKCSSLNPELIREIRSLYASGITQSVLAGRFGIKQQAVSNIILRLRWKFVE